MAALVATALTLVTTQGQAANLILTIDRTTGQIDWLDGITITNTNTTGADDDRRFGNYSTGDALITSPLLQYSGFGSHPAASFDFSADGSTILGIGLATNTVIGTTSFSGTPGGPATPTFADGEIQQFKNLAAGNYTLAPGVSTGWDGGIEIQVVPEPSASLLVLFGSAGFLFFSRHRPKHKNA
ncbi:MAG: PEP-CTERM sorting domain-containing protein [Verrucomicrobiota bacterium]